MQPSVSNTRITLEPAKDRYIKLAIVVVLAGVFVASVNALDLNVAQFISRLGNAGNVLRRFMAFDASVLSAGIGQLTISVLLGVCGLIVGGVIAFVFAFCAAENTTFFKPLGWVIKALVSIIRAVPNLVLILMIVASIGMGYTAGFIALTLSSIGYLTKAFISTIEEQSNDIAEALRAGGASWFQVMYHGYLPHVVTGFISWLAIRMESSVSESISLGVVGAGGIGMLLSRAIRQNNTASLGTLILLIFVFLYALEMAMTKFRRSLQ